MSNLNCKSKKNNVSKKNRTFEYYLKLMNTSERYQENFFDVLKDIDAIETIDICNYQYLNVSFQNENWWIDDKEYFETDIDPRLQADLDYTAQDVEIIVVNGGVCV